MRFWRRRQVDDDEFRIVFHNREVIAYWEGDRAVLFDAAWGAEPPTLYVPSEEMWDEVVPGWLRGRHDIVVRRLAAKSGHRVESTDDPELAELRPVVSSEEARAIATAFLDKARVHIGPWMPEAFEETERGWQLSYRLLEPDRYEAGPPDGRVGIVLVRRDTSEIEAL
jgi:hypothetical protein